MTTVAIWLLLACPTYNGQPGCFNIQFMTQQACVKASADLQKATGIGSNLRQYTAACIPMEIYNK